MKKINFKDLSNNEILTRDELKNITGGGWEDGDGSENEKMCVINCKKDGQNIKQILVGTKCPDNQPELWEQCPEETDGMTCTCF